MESGYGVLPTTQLCFLSTTRQTGSCNGDSGGPAIIHYQGTPMQIGITSWGNETCDPSQPSFYTNLPEYIEWIEKETGLDLQEPTSKLLGFSSSGCDE